MKIDLSGHHALVCGASAGIGRATALCLARCGAALTLLARREARLAEVAGAARDAGAPTADTVVADLDDCGATLRALESRSGAGADVTIVINNATGPSPGPLLEAEDAAFKTALTRHVLTPQTLVRWALPMMRRRGYGRIVNVVSTSVREPIENLGVSNTIRGAVAAWSKTLARELPPGITINSVLPGFTATERLDALRGSVAAAKNQSEEAIQAAWVAQVPEGRLALPEELGAAIAFLASPLAGYIRGISLAVDGGRMRSI